MGRGRRIGVVLGVAVAFVFGVVVGRTSLGAQGDAGSSVSASATAVSTTGRSESTAQRPTVTRRTLRAAQNPNSSETPAAESFSTAVERSEPSTPGAPSTPETALSPYPTTIVPADPTPPLPDSSGWELFGYRAADGQGLNSGAVVRYDSTGTMVTTPVRPLYSTGTPSFAVTDAGAIVLSPSGSGDSYVVADEKPAAATTGDLRGAWAAFPGPGSHGLWAASSSDNGLVNSLTGVSLSGTPTGTTIPIPQAVSVPAVYALSPDGAGYVLASGIGGVYDLRPTGARLVTHGQVLAAGPAGYLVWECDDPGNCAAAVVARADGKRRTLPKFTHTNTGPAGLGVISPDGKYAATLGFDVSGPAVELINLSTGTERALPVAPIQDALGGSTPRMVFTPDSRYLLTSTVNGIVPIDMASDHMLHPLPVPTLVAIAIRPIPAETTATTP